MEFVTGSVQKLALQLAPTPEAGSSKNNMLRMGRGLKEMSEGQLALKSTGPIGPAGRILLLIQNTCASQTL